MHRWLGRALAILGIVQIPLGLTLYGSPKSLFILYAIGAFILLAVFFVLSYLYDPHERYISSDYDSRGSYISGPSVVERSRIYDDSDYTDEKYTEVSEHGGWKKRLLEICAIAGAAVLVKRFFDRRRERESDTESGRYRPAHTRGDSVTEETLSRAEEERPASSHRYRSPSRPSTRDSMDYTPSSYFTNTHVDDRRGHGVRDAILGAGPFTAIRNFFRSRREREEQQRVDEIRRQEMEEERIARANSKRKYSGDEYLPRKTRRASSYTATEITSTDVTRPLDPSHGDSGLSSEPVASGAVNQPPANIPPIPQTHIDPSVSDVHAGGDTHRHHDSDGAVAAELALAAAGAAAAAAAASSVSHRRRRSRSRRRDEPVVSPPVSVKVKMHNDGRHVTLRRLTEAEAAASREARRRERERRGSRRRNTSVSSLSGNEGGTDRWRRVEEMERRQAEEIAREQQAAAGAPPAVPAFSAPSAAPSGNVPPSAAGPPNSNNLGVPPPPAPSSLPYGPGSITSPGTFTGTEASGDYASNRRRRRAERAAARQARQHSVEFT